jgi:hypothetical protein
MRISVYLVLLLLSCGSSKKATTQASVDNKVINLARRIPTESKQTEVDRLAFVYVLSKDNSLIRYSLRDNSKVEYVDNILGRIHDFDVTNPLSINVYYKQYGIVKILDNTLSNIQTINFMSSASFQNVTAVCTANDGNIWIFDETVQKIYKVKSDFEIIVESNRLSDLGLGKVEILKMREVNNRLIVLVKGKGFYIFDNFGQFLRIIKTDLLTSFQVLDENIMQFNQSVCNFYAIEGIEIKSKVIKKDLLPNLIDVKRSGMNWILTYNDGIDLIKEIFE